MGQKILTLLTHGVTCQIWMTTGDKAHRVAAGMRVDTEKGSFTHYFSLR
jgi:hypothetical protein